MCCLCHQSGCSKIEDLGPLSACTRLRHLDLWCCTKVCCTSAGKQVGCGKATLFFPLNSPRFIYHAFHIFCHPFTHLHTCEQLRNLHPLSACTQLSCPQFSHLPPHPSHTFHTCAQLRNLHPLSACTQLQFLDLSYCCIATADLRPLAACAHLRHLDLSK